jgi:hypothetical protein
MPEAPVVDVQQPGMSFNMDDDDLYGEQIGKDGKVVERGQKHDNCVVQ